MTSLLDVRDLTVRFPTAAGGCITAVRDVSFSIARGRTLGLVGESGSGKSVTSLAILRLLPPQARIAGEIALDHRNLLAVTDNEMRRVRGTRISMIFQEPMTALNPVMRVGDQIAEAVLAHGSGQRAAGSSQQDSAASAGAIAGVGRVTKAEAWRRALDAMRDVGIPDHERRARDYPHQLSGGQRQRIMIAMGIVNRPELLVADEPTTALDVTIQAQILDLLAALRDKFRLAMLFISHDLAVVSKVSDEIAVMYAGSIVESGTSAAVFKQPAHPYTRGLLASVPTLKTERGQPLRSIEGTVPSPAALPPGCLFEPRCEQRQPECNLALPPLVEVGPDHLARCPVEQGKTGPVASG